MCVILYILCVSVAFHVNFCIHAEMVSHRHVRERLALADDVVENDAPEIRQYGLWCMLRVGEIGAVMNG